MKLSGTPKRLLMESLKDDKYMIKSLPEESFKYFIDIGANIGLVSILCRLCHPSVKIFSIEPYTPIFKTLLYNVGDLDITCLNRAFSDTSDQTFHIAKQRKSAVCNRFVPGDGNYDIKTINLHNIISKYHIVPKDTFIKLDCEGAEKYIMSDKSLLPILKNIAYLAIEIHPNLSDGYDLNHYSDWIYTSFELTHNIKINDSIITLRRKG